MEITIYQINAFTDKPFGGNQAAVCLINEMLPDRTMQQIATENNLPITTFVMPQDNHYLIRWFKSIGEQKLCGHGTLAGAYVIFNFIEPSKTEITFKHENKSILVTKNNHGLITFDFPILPFEKIDTLAHLGITTQPQEIYRSTIDYMVVVDSEEAVTSLNPDLSELHKLDSRGVIFTSTSKPGAPYDFVSRYFACESGVPPEDQVTGSAHSVLMPYWSQKLQKNTLRAKQLSARSGDLVCVLKQDQVSISGNASLYLKGQINI